MKDEKAQELIEAIQVTNSDVCEAITNLNKCLETVRGELYCILLEMREVTSI